ncbi:MAG TPA: SurA N-terminal domain-containing protein [Steroidobacteraceae bacterium]|nr:SurA N-terminal domain-containing protein [Steroidobacteraceae bacterium]
MLQSIHDKLKGWLAGVVLGAIGLVFVFWGINWTLSAPNYAAKVNGSEISSTEVRQSYQQQLAQFERQANGTIDDLQRNQIKLHVLDEYVNSEAVVTRADDLGYRVSDEELLKAMAQVPAFQVDGKFDKAHAVAVLKAQGRSVAEIENLFRHDVKLRQLDTALSMSSFATASELKQLRALTQQQRELAWFTVPTAKYTAEATADDAALKAYYEAHKANYMTPETVNLRYIEISLTQLESKVKVDDAQLKAYYDEQMTKTPERFSQPEQRRVRHILLQSADAKDDAAVKAKAESILKRAQGGEDFSKLAKEFSQDTGSAQQGGDLGWSERKVWVAPFADAAFSMKEGEIRGPVKTQFGYHILKLDGIQPVTVKTFEQGKSDLEAEYRRNEAERLFSNAQDQLADAALQNTTDIDVVARKAGLVVHDIPVFSRTGGGGDLGSAAAVLTAAFSQDVLDGRLSPIVEMEKGRGVVLRATDHKLPQQKPLEAVRTDVVAAWKIQRGAELAAAAAADAVKRLNAGEAWDAVVKSLGVAAQPAKFVARTDQSVPMAIRREAFEAPKPMQKPVYRNLPVTEGDAVMAMTAVREDPNGDPRELEAQLRRQFAQQSASSESQSYAVAARADAKVTVNPRALD